MGNIIFGMLATPNTHKKFVKEINNFKYDIEGKSFKGTQAPYISELKFYDIRVPEEIESEVIRDLRLWQFNSGTTSSFKFKVVMFFYRMFIKICTPFKPIREVKGKTKYNLDQHCWNYILPVGILKRKKMKTAKNNYREVL
jgi:hypothetical protein